MMKTIILKVMVAVLVIGVAAPMIGGTLATWSDSETSLDNYIETGSLDLKVNGRDDQPWGVGVGPSFWIEDGMPGVDYNSTVELWNAGTEDGTAYLHIRNVTGNLSNNLYVWIYFDSALVEEGYLNDLKDREILLGLLPACQPRDLELKLRVDSGFPCMSTAWDMEFDLLGCWSDSEFNSNYFKVTCELGGTPGFWQSPAAVKLYGKPQLAAWFIEIVLASAWFEDSLAAGTYDEVYDKMFDILKDTGAAGYDGAVNQFRFQYLATRLNTKTTPPRLDLSTAHDISGIVVNGVNASGYFGYDMGTLQQIINSIESKASGGIFAPQPSRPQMLFMKTVCDKLNNVLI